MKPKTKDEIFADAMALDPKQREELAEELWQSVPAELTPEQIAEIKRRLKAIDSGEAELIDGEQVMRQLRARFRRSA
jgi:putative addiction module component (TIGR02574 family)